MNTRTSRIVTARSIVFVYLWGNGMMDLIYTCDNKSYDEIFNIIRKEFPQSIIEDDSDDIHENRFSVEFEIEKNDWFRFIILKGFAFCSLNFQTAIIEKPNEIETLINQLISEGLLKNETKSN